MKKILCMIIGLCLIFALAACGNGRQETPVTPEETTHEPASESFEPHEISIALAPGDLPNGAHMFDYSELRMVRDGSAEFYNSTGDMLIIRTNVTLYEFAVVDLLVDPDAFDEEGVVFIPRDSFGMIETFTPEEAYVIEHYMGVGTFPWSGITFLDAGGQRHYYTIIQNQSDEGDRYLLGGPFEDRTDELPPDWQPWR